MSSEMSTNRPRDTGVSLCHLYSALQWDREIRRLCDVLEEQVLPRVGDMSRRELASHKAIFMGLCLHSDRGAIVDAVIRAGYGKSYAAKLVRKAIRRLEGPDTIWAISEKAERGRGIWGKPGSRPALAGRPVGVFSLGRKPDGLQGGGPDAATGLVLILSGTGRRLLKDVAMLLKVTVNESGLPMGSAFLEMLLRGYVEGITAIEGLKDFSRALSWAVDTNQSLESIDEAFDNAVRAIVETSELAMEHAGPDSPL